MHQYNNVANVQGLTRILVIRLSSLGDILLTTPVLRVLREHCPAARIDFLTKAAYQDVLRANPCVDRLLLLEPQQGLKETLRRLRQTRYDIVVDLQRTLRSCLLYRGLLAQHKLAYTKRTIRRALLVHLGWNTLRAMTPVPELYMAPLRCLGITAPLPPLEMHLTAESQEAMQAYLQQALPEGLARPLLAVAPGGPLVHQAVACRALCCGGSRIGADAGGGSGRVGQWRGYHDWHRSCASG